MDLTTKQWLIGIIITIIIVILIDGFRRMRRARQDSLHMSLDPKQTPSLDDSSVYGSEFPNGGARASEKSIDPERIQKVKSQYDFGRDLNIPVKPTHHTRSDIEEPGEDNYSHDQWVDAEEGDEEYYASQWDESSTEEPEESIENTKDIDEYHDAQVEDESLDVEASDSIDLLAETSIPSQSSASIDRENDDESSHEFVNNDQEVVNASPPDSDDDVAENDEVTDVADGITAKPTTELFQVIETEDDVSSSEEEYQEPTQVPLNLEEAVPLLMDSLEDTELDDIEHDDMSRSEDSIENQSVSAKNTPSKKTKVSSKNNTTNKKKQSAKDQKIVQESLEEDTISASPIQTVGKHIEPTIGDDALDIETHSANKPRFESKYFATKPKDTQVTESSVSSSSDLQEVLVINVKARKGTEFHGNDILQQVLENGMRYGAMNIFHRHQHDDGEGPVIFSMANMLKPGVFDLKNINELSTAGVTFFITLPVYDNNNMAAFELMVTAAKNIAEALDGELNDENRSIMTAQTIEHYRERIRDFSRKQQLAKNK